MFHCSPGTSLKVVSLVRLRGQKKVFWQEFEKRKRKKNFSHYVATHAQSDEIMTRRFEILERRESAK